MRVPLAILFLISDSLASARDPGNRLQWKRQGFTNGTSTMIGTRTAGSSGFPFPTGGGNASTSASSASSGALPPIYTAPTSTFSVGHLTSETHPAGPTLSYPASTSCSTSSSSTMTAPCSSSAVLPATTPCSTSLTIGIPPSYGGNGFSPIPPSIYPTLLNTATAIPTSELSPICPPAYKPNSRQTFVTISGTTITTTCTVPCIPVMSPSQYASNPPPPGDGGNRETNPPVYGPQSTLSTLPAPNSPIVYPLGSQSIPSQNPTGGVGGNPPTYGSQTTLSNPGPKSPSTFVPSSPSAQVTNTQVPSGYGSSPTQPSGGPQTTTGQSPPTYGGASISSPSGVQPSSYSAPSIASNPSSPYKPQTLPQGPAVGPTATEIASPPGSPSPSPAGPASAAYTGGVADVHQRTSRESVIAMAVLAMVLRLC